MPRRFMKVAAVLLSLAAPASAGDSTVSLAAFRAMSAPAAASPSERLLAVYMASAERSEMLSRLRAMYPAALR